MYELVRLLFRKPYWRMLLRGATWHEARASLHRVHKDKRARKQVLQTLLLALVPFLCIAYLAWLVGSGALLILPFLLPVIWWRSRKEKQEAPLSILPSTKPVERSPTPDDLKRLRRHLVELALCYAVMVDRAGSEGFLKQKELPDGVEVTTRRTHLAFLRTHGLWEKMSQQDRDLLIIADGHWQWEQINKVSRALEPLRLLRWILKIDFFLPLVGQQLKGSYTLASELLQLPDKVFKGEGLVDIATIRIGRDAAREFYARCLAEVINRGDYKVNDEELTHWAKELSGSMHGKQNEDLVLGTTLVSEASREQLHWALFLSHARTEFLNHMLSVFEGAPLP